MAKIIEVQDQAVMVEDGKSTQTILRSYFTFEPVVGDEVSVYQSGSNVAVLKMDSTAETKKDSGIMSIFNKLFPKKKTSVNKVVYCLLALFLGNCGVHKFYAGKIAMGIVYVILATTGVSTILSGIDLASALFKRADADKKIMV